MLEISVDMCYNKYYLLPRQKRGGGTMDAYNAFMHSLDNYSGCSFLVAGKRLSLLLSDFTAVEEFTLFLRNILPAFNYADEFSRASIPLEQIGDNVRSKLILPRQESVRFAFIVCLLTEIDSGKRDFVLFLREYFDCGDTQKSFEYFCREIILPFRELSRDLYSRLSANRSVPAENEKRDVYTDILSQTARDISVSRNANLLISDISVIESELKEIRALGKKMKKERSEELENILGFFSYSVYMQNELYIVAAFTGLKYTLRAFKIAETRLKKTADILAKRGITGSTWNWPC